MQGNLQSFHVTWFPKHPNRVETFSLVRIACHIDEFAQSLPASEWLKELESFQL
jgi:hypothetical protein